MPRKLEGSVLTTRLADGRRSYAVKIRAKRVKVGEEPLWDEDRVRTLRDDVLLPAAKLNLPWWERIPGRAAPAARPAVDLNFHVVASDYAHGVGRNTNPNTVSATLSPVRKHLLPFLAYEDAERTRPRSLAAIDGSLVTQFTDAKQEERAAMQDLKLTLAELEDDVLRDTVALEKQLDKREWELLRRYGQRGGRLPLSDPGAMSGRVSLSSKGLSNNEINRCLTQLRAIVDYANHNYDDLDLRDPTYKRRLPREDPPRDWLRPDVLQACFDAAAEIDERVFSRGDFEARRHGKLVTVRGHVGAGPDYRGLGRHAAVVTFGLAGPRTSELANARARHFHDSEGVLHIPESKTSAGERDIELHVPVLEVLRARVEKYGLTGDDYLWETAAGTRRDRNSVRTRLLEPVLARAAELLAERGQREMPARVTPHTFRRTYLTYLGWMAKTHRFATERYAMQQAGHKDSSLTMECYQQQTPSKLDPRVPVWLALPE